MTTRGSAEMKWIRLGVVAGLLTSVVYPVLVFAPLPLPITAALAAAIGPLLGAASFGLYRILRLSSGSIAPAIAAVSNIVAGALLSTMLLVQIAVRARADADPVSPSIVAVWLGLDVAWDAYVGLGTLLFAAGMWVHPRFGRIFAGSGALIGAILLALNLLTFPEPPAERGLFDVGPFVGLWYLAVTIQVARSLGWAGRVLTSADVPRPS